MGRRVPLPLNDLSLHPLLSFSIFFAGMVAALSMVTTLCGVRFWKRSFEPSKQSSDEGSKLKTESAKIDVAPQEGSQSENVDSTEVKELPLPPSKQLKPMQSFNPNGVTKSASMRNIVASMSMKLPRSFSMARKGDEKEEHWNHHHKKKGKLKPEDSVWMKAIILGEKCKVPDDDEVTVYDGKGNRISTYHPKTLTSLPVSRQNSQIDVNAIPSHQDTTSMHQPKSSISRQTSQIDPDAMPGQDRGKPVTNNQGEVS